MKDSTRPRVTIHYAQTLDGRIATRTRQSQWIGGDESLRFAHQLRAEHGAILVGVGTVLADNPRLTVRLVTGRSPLRIVLDSTLRLPMEANLLTDGKAETLIATTARAAEARILAVRRQGAGVVVVNQDDEGRVDLADLLRHLSGLGIASVMIEGGRGVITSALKQRMVDRLIVCISPKLLGTGIEAVGDLGIDSLGQALTFAEMAITPLGEDLLFDGWIRRETGDGGEGNPEPSALTPTLSQGESEHSSLVTHHSSLAPRLATAAWFPAPRRVELRRERLPEVGPGQVRVRTVASAPSHGTEMLVYRGQVPPEMELDLPTLLGSFGFPIKYGYAAAGRVVEVGDGVQSLREGDLVFVHHPHQTEYVVPASLPIPLPPDLAPEDGVFLANLETAVNVLLDAAPRLGERVVIFGQGVVGLLLTQLARRGGAGLIIAVEPLERRRGLALELGADAALAPTEGLAEEVQRLTGGVGADLALEASGSVLALQQAMDCVAFQGTVVVCSWFGSKPATLQLGSAFHRRRLRLVSSQVSSLDPALQPRWSKPRRLELACKLLQQLPLRRLVTHRIPFRRVAEAYTLVDLHPEEVVQILLTYEAGDI